MNPTYFVIAAYAFGWGFILIYILTLSIRIKTLKQDLESLKKK